MTARARFEGGKEIARKLKKMSRDIRTKELDRASRAGAALVRDEAKLRAPMDTGLLRRAIIFRKQRRLSTGYSTAYAVGVGSKAWYFPLVEFGAQPHVIRAERVRVLASFTSNMAGAVNRQVFGAVVHHTGAPANPFFRSAWESRKVAVKDKMAEVLRKRVLRR